ASTRATRCSRLHSIAGGLIGRAARRCRNARPLARPEARDELLARGVGVARASPTVELELPLAAEDEGHLPGRVAALQVVLPRLLSRHLECAAGECRVELVLEPRRNALDLRLHLGEQRRAVSARERQNGHLYDLPS